MKWATARKNGMDKIIRPSQLVDMAEWQVRYVGVTIAFTFAKRCPLRTVLESRP